MYNEKGEMIIFNKRTSLLYRTWTMHVFEKIRNDLYNGIIAEYR